MSKALNGKYLIVGVCLALMLGIVGVLTAQVKSAPSSVFVEQTATATTTVSYVGVGVATSTYQLDSNGQLSSNQTKVITMAPIDAVSLYLWAGASSTSAVINVGIQVSNNGVDWYNVVQPYALSSVSVNAQPLSTSSVYYTWTPNVVGTSSIAISLPQIPTQHERVVFSGTGAGYLLYAETNLKELPSNQ